MKNRFKFKRDSEARKKEEDGTFTLQGMVESARLVQKIAEFVEPRHFPTLEIIDWGCGIGKLLRYMRHIFPRLYGYDISTECTRRASYYQSELGGVTDDFKIFHPERFSVIYSYDYLDHFEEKGLNEEIERIHNLLKPKGTAFLHYSNAGYSKPFEKYNIEEIASCETLTYFVIKK